MILETKHKTKGLQESTKNYMHLPPVVIEFLSTFNVLPPLPLLL